MEKYEDMSMPNFAEVEVKNLLSFYERFVVICHFNDLWPPTLEYISGAILTWMKHCEVYVFSDGIMF